MITVETLHYFYEYFYRKKYKNPKFKLGKSSIEIKNAETFLNLCNKKYGNSVGRDFLYRYFVFQFQYWEGVNFSGTNVYNKSINLTFIIGPKAFKRYIDRNTEYDWMTDQSKIISLYGIVRSDLVFETDTKQKLVVSGKIDTEAAIKLAAYNTTEGFITCIDFSTLYSETSDICRGCIYSVECKQALKNLYPKTYSARGFK